MNHWIIRSAPRVLIAGALLTLLAGCAEESDEARRERLHLPAPDYTTDITRGAEQFTVNCVVCHGASARGTPQGPPLIHKYYEPSHHGDYSFHAAVRDGVKQHHWQFGDMPAIANVSPEHVADIIRYVRSLQVRAGIR